MQQPGRLQFILRVGLVVSCALLMSGCAGSGRQDTFTGGYREERVSRGGGRVYFSYEDARYDDRGPGTYQYPISFENREGFLDMTNFTVSDGGDNVIFTIEFRRPIPRRRLDGSSEAKGWWLHLIDIYIDKDREVGSGYTQALPGRNVVFEPQSAWEKVVLVTPESSRTVERMMEERTSDLDLIRMRRDVIVPHRAYAEGYQMRVLVPKHEIGTPQPYWGYQVLVMAFDRNNLGMGQFQNAEVGKFAQNDRFGGGCDYRGNPNVIDMLAPTATEQYRILSDHVSRPFSGDDRWAVISCVYPETRDTSPSRPPGEGHTTPTLEQPIPVTQKRDSWHSEPDERRADEIAPTTQRERPRVHSFEGGF